MTLSRKYKLLLACLLAMVLTILAPIFWLLHTTSGAVWLWNRVEALDVGKVTAAEVTGDLANGVLIQRLDYRSDDLDLSVRQVEIQAGVAWWPLSIKIRKLALLETAILVRDHDAVAVPADGGTDIGGLLSGLSPPLPVRIDHASLSHISLRQENDPAVIEIDSIDFGVSLDKRLEIDHLDFQAGGIESSARASLQLAPPFELVFDLDSRLDVALASGGRSFVLPLRLEGSGDLHDLKLRLTSAGNGLQVDGEVMNTLNQPQWGLDASLDGITLPEDLGGQDISLSDISLAGRGDLREWSFEIGSALTEEHAGNSQVAVTGTGTPDGVEITGASVTGTGIDLDFSGKLDWSETFQVNLKTAIRRLDLSPWMAEWPAGEFLAGELELEWSGQGLRIPLGHLAIENTPTTIDFDADIDMAAESVSARLNWSGLAWPPGDATAVFSSRSGHLNVSGGLSDWRAGGQLDVQLGDYPRGRVEIDGGGNRTSARVMVTKGEVLGGVIRGEMGADWRSDLTWEAAIEAQGIDPSPVLADWPGKLDGNIEIKTGGEPRWTRIDIKSLQGLLRGTPVSAHGGIELTESGTGFKALEVRTDQALLKLDGATADPAGVRFSFDGEIPALLLEGARGSAQAEGRYTEVAARPQLDLQLHGAGLAWNDIGINTLDIAATSNTGTESLLQLDASSVAWRDVNVDTLSLSVDPAGSQYRIGLMLSGGDVVLNSVMQMAPVSGKAGLDSQWQGVVSTIDLDVGPAYSFGLSQPAALAWSPGGISMEPLCMFEQSGPTLCLDFDYRDNGDWSLAADANAIPLDYLRDAFDLDIHLEQTLDGHLDWNQLHGQAPTGGADFRITAGRILDLLDNDVLTTTNEGKLAFSLQNGNLESGVLKIEFPGTGFIDADFDVLDIASDGEQKIQGRVISQLDRLALLGQLSLPRVDAVDGQFETDIRIGGSLRNPELEGGFKLSNGLIEYTPIGFSLENIEVQGDLHKHGNGEFRGSFKAGEGIAAFSGDFLFDDVGKPHLTVGLSGESLTLANTDSLKILSEPDFRVAISPERIDINGQIAIPTASLTPETLQFEVVRDSEDLVVESPEQQAEVHQAGEASENRIYGQLDVSLGDDVRVKVPGIDAKITGSALFNWNGESVPIAQGAYHIRGKVDIYGPTLRIDNGTVSFPDVPANNPLLNIRAGRDIYGNTQIRSAGVQVIGNLKHPVLEAYTVPITNEDRAWTLLVTGTDFDQAQGVSGFDLGTYIAPRLYVSYGVSLFEDENVVSARYDLKKGFGIKVTSGQRETGLDISYTINR